MIDGKEYVAEDKGGAIQGSMIDMYVGSEAESIDYGVRYQEVYIKDK